MPEVQFPLSSWQWKNADKPILALLQSNKIKPFSAKCKDDVKQSKNVVELTHYVYA